MSLERCRVVLVRPQVAGNLGATARVMHNMGLSHLVLVAPEADPRDRRARQLSTHGESILERATIVSELGDAVADCVLVAGTSSSITSIRLPMLRTFAFEGLNAPSKRRVPSG